MRWYHRKCFRCGVTTAAMAFKTGLCEGQVHCPHCGSDKGEDLPLEAEFAEQYMVSPKIKEAVPEAYRTMIIEWTVMEFAREIEKQYGTPVRMTAKGELVKALNWAFQSLNTYAEMERMERSKKNACRVSKKKA